MTDLRFAIRMLRKSPGFTLTAVLSLALGIGANTAIFSLIDALLLRMLPVRDPQQLVELFILIEGRRIDSFSYPVVRILSERASMFSGLCGFSGTAFNAGPPGTATRTAGAWVSGAYYETLGVQPALGRMLTRDDDQPGAAPVAVLSYSYWEGSYARDPGVIGRSILLEGRPVTIVGVSAPGFNGANVGQVADITVALGVLPRVTPESAARIAADSQWLRILARPKPGISLSQAKAGLAVLWPQLVENAVTPIKNPVTRRVMLASTLDVSPGGTGWSSLRNQFGRPLLVLMTVVAAVLIIACANVANLLLARAAARQREIAIRLAVGAGRGRLIRQLLTESVLLSAIGAAAGILFAYSGSRFLLRLISTGRPEAIVLDLRPDLRVLLFTSLVALVTGILFGLAPAFRATAVRGPSASRGRLAHALVITQVSLSLLLLVGAGLFVRTLQNLQNLDTGFRHDGVLLINVDPRASGYKDVRLAAVYRKLLDQLGSLPGVASVSLSINTPLSGGIISFPVQAEGQSRTAHFNSISPRYFETLRTPIVAGRDFTVRDDAAAPKVAIVNEEFVRRLIPEGNPLGKRVSLIEHDPEWHDVEIVGVARNATAFNIREPAPPAIYIPFFESLTSMARATIEVHAVGSLSQAASAVRRQIHARLPDTPVQLQAFTAQVSRALVQEQVMASLAGFFGVLALGLAAIGLYGLIAYRVLRRTGEIGIRMALGARRGDVLWLVLQDAVRLVAAGVLFGLPAAWAASRLVSSMLFGVTATDPGTVSGALALLSAAALFAAFIPAVRAARVEPMTALRNE